MLKNNNHQGIIPMLFSISHNDGEVLIIKWNSINAVRRFQDGKDWYIRVYFQDTWYQFSDCLDADELFHLWSDQCILPSMAE